MFASLACARGSAISRSRHSLKSWRLVFSRSAHRETRVLKDLASGLRVRVFGLRQKRMGTFRYRAGTVGDACERCGETNLSYRVRAKTIATIAARIATAHASQVPLVRSPRRVDF